ncbi:hypothetical protein PG997_012750 [Apiospora hydei]|uniref:STI1 domain-containing protein n=1 Tax=Apiospora hydei TaxID=1337664 RepID=A0ABR1V7P3_9PEZI
MSTADELKAIGNKAIADKNFDEAVDAFTKAIALDASNHVLYSNRSAAYASKKDWDNALKDGWGRKGTALHGKGDLLGANDAYEEGLKHDPNNAGLKSSLASVQRAMEQDAGGPMGGDPLGGMGQMFKDPNLMQKLMNNPKTSGYFSDPSFMAKVQQLQQNPSSTQDLFSDPRMIQPPGDMPGGAGAKEAEEDVDMPDLVPNDTKTKAEPEQKKAKAEADKEKAAGTENYKKRNFDEAIKHYSAAWDLYKDITYLNNPGAAYFEKGDYQTCIDTCTKAIDEGREIYADFKMIAKSYARIGIADRAPNPEVNTKLRTAERNKIEAAKKAYIDPQKAEEAREEGNKKFKEQDFPGAVAAYSEMVKRAPEDPRGYSNRAAAFVKLFEFPSALQDCDLAIKKDPKFIRAYIRKAQVYFGMREYSKCLDACTEATEIDNEHHNGANARELSQQQEKAIQAMYSARDNETEEQTRERLQKDPEIMSIMQDPVMQAILQQAQSDPAALQEHMKNPSVRSNIQKLVAAGVIRMGR